MACPHCHAEFIASEQRARQSASEEVLMDRVERVLRQSGDAVSVE
ncbi:hypothetical protein [Roseimaritima sediminicola]|nr:hypothetical protein [Roseimaritima sediminicola]